MIKQKTKDVIKILEDNKLTNIYSPEDQIKMQLNKKVETLESQKEELALGMKESRHQEYVRKEMNKIRDEGYLYTMYRKENGTLKIGYSRTNNLRDTERFLNLSI